MKVIKIWGGVGNQLFQYALYKSVLNRGFTALIDDSWFRDKGRKYYYPYQLDLLGLKAEVIKPTFPQYHTQYGFELLRHTGKRALNIPFNVLYRLGRIGRTTLKNVTEDNVYGYQNEVFNEEDSYLAGFWQNMHYFEDVLPQIIQEISFDKIVVDDETRSLIKQISTCNSVSVHVRRNDYDFETFNSVSDQSYYKVAIEEISQKMNNPQFFIFSNKITSAREMFGDDSKIHYVNLNDRCHGIGDLMLMSLCKHNIISNSTFGWWAAIMNRNYKKIVIMPRKWTQIDGEFNLMPEDWEIL